MPTRTIDRTLYSFSEVLADELVPVDGIYGSWKSMALAKEVAATMLSARD